LGSRLLSGGVAGACAGVLAFAGRLDPAAQGHGTHEQLGRPPCPWPAFFGLPCPTCGMTTAFARAADGDLVGSFHAQPFGLLLALGAAVAFWVTAYVCVTGSRAGAVFGGMLRPRVMWGIAALGVAAWMYKIAVWPE
jgi:hypothetical protein